MYPKLGLAGMLLALTPLMAADFWEEKKFTEWNDRQVRRILEDSPWAHQIGRASCRERV